MVKYYIIIIVAGTIWILSSFDISNNSINRSVSLQSRISPGKLSTAHAQLATNCASCHTAVKGIDDAKCISCHADNKALLGRQPTAFHANIGNCSSCHIEHQGADANLRVMNHETLARIGTKLINRETDMPNKPNNPADYPRVSVLESTLNCANCHSTKDKHVGFFGQNCASCHATNKWTIQAFQHPSVRSIACAECHKAPPSHYMMHFSMISKKIAGQENALVNQCYSCHKTTVWNDIQGVGFYKHH